MLIQSLGCGFIVLKVHEVDLGVNNVYLTLKIDDYAFPSYVSPLFRNPRGVINDGKSASRFYSILKTYQVTN